MKRLLSLALIYFLAAANLRPQMIVVRRAIAAGASPAISIIGTGKTSVVNASNETTRTIPAFDSNVAVGDTIVAFSNFCADVGCTVLYPGAYGMTSLLGNTFQLDTSQIAIDLSGSVYAVAIWSSHVTVAGTEALTATCDTCYYMSAGAANWAHVKSTSWADGTGEGHSSGSTNPSVSLTTTADGDLVYAACAGQNAQTVGSGYTSLGTTNFQGIHEYKIATTAGSETATTTASSGKWQCVGVSYFKAP